MTAKRFTKEDRQHGTKVIRSLCDAFIAMTGGLCDIPRWDNEKEVQLTRWVQQFTENLVTLTFQNDGIIVHGLEATDIRHKLSYPFKAKTWWVTLNWAQAKVLLSIHVTLEDEERTSQPDIQDPKLESQHPAPTRDMTWD